MFGLTASLFTFAATSSTPKPAKSHDGLTVDSASVDHEQNGRESERAIESSRPKSSISLFREFEIHDTWACISAIHRNNSNLALCNYCCFMLYQMPVSEVEFYLPQLCILLVYQPRHIAMLEMFILDQCARSIHFALKTDFLLDAVSTPDSGYYMERVGNLRYAVQLAAIDGTRPKLGKNASPITLHTEGGTKKERRSAMVQAEKSYSDSSLVWMSDDETYMPKSYPVFFDWCCQGDEEEAESMNCCFEKVEDEQVRYEAYKTDLKKEPDSRDKEGEAVETVRVKASDDGVKEYPAEGDKQSSTSSLKNDKVEERDGVSPPTYEASGKCGSLPNISVSEMSEKPKLPCSHLGLSSKELWTKTSLASLDLELAVPYSRSDRATNDTFLQLDSTSFNLLGVPLLSSDKRVRNTGQSPVDDLSAGKSYLPLFPIRRRHSGSLLPTKKPLVGSVRNSISVTGQNVGYVRNLRYKYIWSIKRFVKELSDIGSRLLQAPEEARAKNLRIYLRELNMKMSSAGENPKQSIYMPGLYLPFSKSHEPHYSIVRIPEHEASVLKSKVRAPYMIYFETISLAPLEREARDDLATDFAFEEKSLRAVDARLGSERLKGHLFRESVIWTRMSEKFRWKKVSDLLKIYHQSSYRHMNRSLLLNYTRNRLGMNCGDPLLEMLALTYMPFLSPKAPPASLSLKNARTPLSTTTNGSTTSLLNQDNTSELAGEPADIQELLSKPQNANTLHLRELWRSKEKRIRLHSPFGGYTGWRLQSVIVKYGKDCLQEQLSLQLVRQFADIFKASDLPLILVPYEAFVLDGNSCLIEPLVDTFSVHQLKKYNNNITLNEYFLRKWNGPHSPEYKVARINFTRSLAAYSLICYLLQLKDRHNGNILIDDNTGYIIHIDWGYLIFNSPGSMGFENAPFKLTQEYVDVLGGVDSAQYKLFKQLFIDGFFELRKYADRIIQMVEIMFMCGNTQKLPCSIGGYQAIESLAQRFMRNFSDQECICQLENLIFLSYGNWRTKRYDNFQWYSNGIFY
ncbi:phosphatidylinositol 4-kinase-like [Schistocerca gregaria]|uniref:phosphatidylinositol 4-kinase-like n=1 Tax=Schistocerca gregaria TaxID=7010 RepID=UPI00211E8A8A|nr:phosphatidylinositol 4-kinase-like [Schistocerca gregaria]